MPERTDWVVLAAKAASIMLGLCALLFGAVFLKSVYEFLALGPENGATGVLMIDTMFVGFISFVMSRVLWIYARKRQHRNVAEER